MRIHRQHFRGQLWYVLQDHTTGRFHRFTPEAYLIISLMDGRRTIQRIWDIAYGQLDDDVLTQDEVIRLLSQLHHSDVLHTDSSPDIEKMSEREKKVRLRKLVASVLNPMAVRIPLLDPDAFLSATMPLARPLFSWFGVLLFLGVVGYGVVVAALHWGELTGNIFDRVFAAQNMLLFVITYPCVKALHELGHGYAIKRWGGEVHEMGVMFLVFMPVPYVDASAAAAFREKWRRVLVGAAGILVELVLAALALKVWLEVEEGLVRAIAFNVMLIGGVSTLFFNGNPLLRFDGYYVLADFLEIPNLANRANRYIGYLIQRRLFGVTSVVSPATAPGEPRWLLIYGIASFCYRVFVITVIVLLVATYFFIIGVLLAIWGVIMMVGIPIVKHSWFVLTSPVLRRRRGRALAVIVGTLAVVMGVLLLVPVPYATVAEGVVWTAGETTINAGTEGTVVELYKPANAQVVAGEPLLLLEDPLLDARVRALQARAKESRLRYQAAVVTDRTEAKIALEQLERAQDDLAYHQQLQQELLVRSPGDGQFILSRPADLIGKFLQKGELLGYVAAFEAPIVHVVVPEDAADLIRQRTRRVQARLVDRLNKIHGAVIALELPLLTDRLPSPALSTAGGGEILLDPSDPQNPKALRRMLQLELRFEQPLLIATLGKRIYVRFDHGNEPLAWRMYRNVRQLFLKRFNV